MKVVCRPRIYNARVAHTLRSATVRETPATWNGSLAWVGFAGPIRHAEDELQRRDVELRHRLRLWAGVVVLSAMIFAMGYCTGVTL